MVQFWKSIWRKFGIVLFWLSWPVLLVYLRGSQRTRMMIVCADEILVTKTWLGDGRWSLPGGGLHRGEGLVEGVIREVFEETGVQLVPSRVTYLDSEIYSSHGLKFQCHYYKTHVDEKPRISLQKFEISDAEWVQFRLQRNAQFSPDILHAVQFLTSSF